MHLVTTADGSHTLYVPQLNEHYHSANGALTESLHVFISAAQQMMEARDELSVFEAGFGTGLNTLLTCLAAIEHHTRVTYHTVEKFPVDESLIRQLNYASLLPADPDPGALFDRIHEASWDILCNVHPCFHLHKISKDLISYQPDFTYDLVFYDAFAPEKQPGMWSQDIFDRLYKNLNPGGMLATYCAKGEVRRMLGSAGFNVIKLPGPPGKREMLRGYKD